MIKKSVMLGLILSSMVMSAFADDAETNPTAKKIKQQLIKQLKKDQFSLSGYCDVFIYMRHVTAKKAEVRKATSTGSSHQCKEIEQLIRVGKKYSYQQPEYIIRIHIEDRHL
ncbi:hypothetical protein CAG54_02110 [Vibrio sp. V27_P1S3P104]|uniref:hypothetical protein n=1 Tax=Vibrio TaxID=662 RepID=UPI000C16D68A|nr:MULTISPECIES: hypothetical protein [Vibrio]NAW68796.1 hypothetical protein [Vibrio sp. V28_P6S34P95]NAX03703.1 hypothetical protein [Vibrio sp. V30_P3S12P165]NAX34670.1 hypothetical protein [Vibrio sp. V29_P1S30P107]NAX36319.1 hypothetical protein [Vibrio sp. V27_P1S3P104]NAX39117.1 hypothetical protein [Vibrio sp. V26_P1S5P106]